MEDYGGQLIFVLVVCKRCALLGGVNFDKTLAPHYVYVYNAAYARHQKACGGYREAEVASACKGRVRSFVNLSVVERLPRALARSRMQADARGGNKSLRTYRPRRNYRYNQSAEGPE